VDFAAAIRYLESAMRFGIEPSLDGIRALADAMGRPQDAFVSVQITGTTRLPVRMLTSSIEMTSSGLVIARTRLPLSSTRSGIRRWRTMKSRGSRPMALASGVICTTSATPMRI